MRVVWNEHNGQSLLDWFVSKLPIHEHWAPDMCRAAAIVDDEDAIAGVVVFHHWNPNYRTLQVSAAAADARWTLARSCWRELFSYAFDFCGAVKVYAETPAPNERAVRFLKAVGMTPKAVLDHHFGPGIHGIYSDRTVWQHKRTPPPPALPAHLWAPFLAMLKDTPHVQNA